MDINFYVTFNKARNSTARPSGTPVTLSGILKEECSIYEPIVKIAMDNFSVDTAQKRIIYFNYCYIPEFGRYYFVVDKVYTLGYWEFHLHCDVLGTWRTVIGSSNQYITRSGVPGDVDDPLYEPTLKPWLDNNMRINQIFDDDYVDHTPGVNDDLVGNGMYIITMAGAPDNPTGQFVNNTYALNKSDFESFRAELSTSSYTGISAAQDDLTENVAKVLINPFQYIINCYYLPISESRLQIDGTWKKIKYGWYSLNTRGLCIENPFVVKTMYDGPLFKHPDYATTHKRMYNDSRWIRYWLEYMIIGRIPIPNDPIIDADAFYMFYVMDLTSGDVTIIGQGSANGSSAGFERFVIDRQNWGISIPLSSYLRDPASVQNSLLSPINTAAAVGKDLLTLDVSGAINDITKGVTQAKTAGARAQAAQVQSKGAPGSFAAMGYPGAGIVAQFYNHPHDATNGSAFLPKIGNLSLMQTTVSGVANIQGTTTPSLIVCGQPVLYESGTTATGAQWSQVEYDEIMNYMRSGFYYV